MTAINKMLVKGIAPPDKHYSRLQKYRLTEKGKRRFQ